jgi:hypothetical protein
MEDRQDGFKPGRTCDLLNRHTVFVGLVPWCARVDTKPSMGDMALLV